MADADLSALAETQDIVLETQYVDDDEVEYTVKVEDRKTDRRSQEDAAYDALKGGLRTFLRETFGTIDKELLARANGGA